MSKYKGTVKTNIYFKLKLNLLLFLSYFMDTSKWIDNFMKDIQENNGRYISVKIEEGNDE